jgi:hypothetical protein
MSNDPWYSAKCIFFHKGLRDESDVPVYEERIVLLKADSFDQAIEQAEEDAVQYASDVEDCEYCGFVDVYHLYDEAVGHGTEIYSLMRSSSLSIEDYLSTFYDTGAERSGPTGEGEDGEEGTVE